MPPFVQPGGHFDSAFHRVGFKHLVLGEAKTLEGDLAHRDPYTGLAETSELLLELRRVLLVRAQDLDAVTRHLHGTTLPPRAWDHLVPHRAGRP
jgi:hypothetical protein